MAQVCNLLRPKGAFGTLHEKGVLLERKHNAEMCQMLGPNRAIDQYVIKEHQDKLPKIGTKDIIPQIMKSGRGIGKAEGYYQELIMPVMIIEYSFGYINQIHAYLVVSRAEIQFKKIYVSASSSNNSSMSGIEYLSFKVIRLSAR